MKKDKQAEKVKKENKKSPQYDLAQDIMPPGEKVEASRMHKDRFTK